MKLQNLPKFNQEPDNIKVPRTDGVVESGDALVVGSRGIRDLTSGDLDQIEFTFQGRVQKQSEWVKADMAVRGLRPIHALQVRRLDDRDGLRLVRVNRVLLKVRNLRGIRKWETNR